MRPASRISCGHFFPAWFIWKFVYLRSQGLLVPQSQFQVLQTFCTIYSVPWNYVYFEGSYRLDFRRSLVSGVPSPRRTAGRVSSKACLWRKFLIKILVALLVVRNCHVMTIIGGPTWRLQLVTFIHVPFSPPPLLTLAFQPILFHTIVTEGHYMLFSIEEFKKK